MTQDARRSAAMGVAAVAAVCAMVVTGAGVAAAASGGTWGTAREVPGTAALNQGLPAEALSVSCASAGNCSAGGYYTDGSRHSQAFVASEVNGTWHTAIEVPGTARPQPGRASGGQLGVVCLGGQLRRGRVLHRQLRPRAGVRRQRGERHLARGQRGPRHRRPQPGGSAGSTRCRVPRRATAPRRVYTDSSGNEQAFVVSEVNGTWHTAIEVPGTAALNQGGGSRRSARCRAPRRATAPPAGSTPTAPANSRRSSSAR